MKAHFILYPLLFILLQSCLSEQQQPESAPLQLSAPGLKASSVFLTQDEKDNPVVSWVELDTAGTKHFYFAHWNEATQAFDAGMPIPILTIANTHEEGMPKLAFKGDGTIIATYETTVASEKSHFGLSDILYLVSNDKGKTWTAPQSIQAHPEAGSRSFGSILRLDDGEIGISWLDTDPNEVGRPVKFARSNAHNSFEPAVLLESAACQCCRTAIASDGEGHVQVVFRDLLPGSVRDIAMSNSDDYGRSFDRAIPFSNDQWAVDGCPHAGPSVASKDGKTYVAWYTGARREGVFYAELAKNKLQFKQQLYPDARFIQLALTPNGTPVLAYQANYEEAGNIYSKIIVAKRSKEGFLERAVSAAKTRPSYPVLQAIDDERMLVAWSDQQQVYYRVVQLRSVTEQTQATEDLAIATSEKRLFPELDVTTDPVCGMSVNAETVADTTLSQGKVVGFCSAACKDRFLKEIK